MASFDCPNAEREVARYPVQRVERLLRRLTKVLQIDLSRLEKHCTNIRRFQNAGSLPALHREQVNATATVQQITGTLRQISQMRVQVQESDLHIFDRLIQDIHNEATIATQEFLTTNHVSSDENKSRENNDNIINKSDSSMTNTNFGYTSCDSETTKLYGHNTGNEHSSNSADSRLVTQLCVDRSSISNESTESWQELQGNLEELNTLIVDYAAVVHSQQEKVDTIEGNIENAQENVVQATTTLGKVNT